MDAAKADQKPMAAAAAAAKRRHRQRHLRTMVARLLRLAEAVAAALLLLSWSSSSSSSSSSRLPAAGEHLRRVASLLLSPRFVFLLGNAIVLLLFAGSRHLSPLPSTSPSPSPSPPPSAPNPSPDPAPVAGDLYREFLESRGYSFPAPALEDKEAARVEMRRSKSERIEGKQQQQRRRRRSPELRRSETDLGCRTRRKEEVAAVAAEEEWVPSAEEAAEFRRTIEAFIAKQTNFHREESIAIVSFSPSIESSAVKTEAIAFQR